MAYGLQCFNEYGYKILDTSKNSTYIVGRGSTRTTPQPINVEMPQGTHLWLLIVGADDSGVVYNAQCQHPSFNINGNTITWSGGNVYCDFIYGWY